MRSPQLADKPPVCFTGFIENKTNNCDNDVARGADAVIAAALLPRAAARLCRAAARGARQEITQLLN